MQEQYRLEYLPVFYKDLEQSVDYILNKLKNPQAAYDFTEAVEEAIRKRLQNAESFEKYPSKRNRAEIYYRIYVKNYVVYYVVKSASDGKVMEVRRLLHERQNRSDIV